MHDLCRVTMIELLSGRTQPVPSRTTATASNALLVSAYTLRTQREGSCGSEQEVCLGSDKPKSVVYSHLVIVLRDKKECFSQLPKT